MATTIGVIQLLATIDTSQYKAGENRLSKAIRTLLTLPTLLKRVQTLLLVG